MTTDTSVTETPAAASTRAVPPVESTSQPRSASALPNSAIPVLSDTLSSALRLVTGASEGLLDSLSEYRGR